ncbi:YrdB family protein [Rathayibacter toxicus]|uniref:DUF2568 domain-containing protein n=1 Tax=Rathayibacter toxicus TaxID=145458 RepID=A0A2S5Y8Y9_9MICO|nr:YrdB family protein [Rathayibacter toxicus]PPH24935.1 DUF2568 domain-containing protein [Rathayibacter toxicus]PPH58859.1 DUF2568 domain-containing protein [Rathayibacter toxicus]PPH60855.1 DUF2568 domain-containing protein [Rathayibacter toxicus]PPH88675.1 DUF2568 domain-containing protein [Rathayibacter toxicus]PPI16367.1 DUF2568 domain-containing protein [Rathayibacter toxicus]
MNRASATRATAELTIRPNDIVRFVLELFALTSFTIWGFTCWDVPLNIGFGIGAPLVAALVWALFVSPRAVLTVEIYARSLIELLMMGAAALTWLQRNQPFVALVFGIVAVVSGLIAGRRAL